MKIENTQLYDFVKICWGFLTKNKNVGSYDRGMVYVQYVKNEEEKRFEEITKMLDYLIEEKDFQRELLQYLETLENKKEEN